MSRWEVNTKCSVGRVLASYRSGKMPKAFKIIPTLKNWEEVRVWHAVAE